jgi:16S rRNA (uracil1498-N3)-methyltransferase
MTARLFIEPERLTGETLTVDGPAYKHLVRVLRVQIGDVLGVFDGLGNEIDAEVLSIERQTIMLRLGVRRTIPAPATRITLLQVLPRADRMELIVQKTTELGVTAIVPVVTARASLDAEQASGKLERWRTIAREAARQCGRADVPRIDKPLGLDEAARNVAPGSVRLVLWESENQRSLSRSIPEGCRDIVLLIGPEGGFSPDDVTRVAGLGFVSVGLGPRILRAETAAIVAVALCQATTGGLDS